MGREGGLPKAIRRRSILKQILQSLQSGAIRVEEVPRPGPDPQWVLIRTCRSLISAGTERMLNDFGRAGWLGKIRQQPDRWRELKDKTFRDGPWAAWQAVRAKLDSPLPMGYCNTGRVLEGGAGVFQDGQRVVSNGPHAEVVHVSPWLVAAIPETVSDEAASFTPLAAIALEGIELLQSKPGDPVMVMGLGLIGQLAVRLLQGMGRKVLGSDLDPVRRAMAAAQGAKVISPEDNAMETALAWTRGEGVAGVLITAHSAGDGLVSEAARSCRYRGRVVLVGVVGLRLNRADFYRNEISLQVSCSYGQRNHAGPGSAQANFRQILHFMEAGRLPVEDLITHRFPLREAFRAYEALKDKKSLGILLDYSALKEGSGEKERAGREIRLRKTPESSKPRVCFLGAGNFAVRTLLPALGKGGVKPEMVISRLGASALYAGKKFGASRVGTDPSVSWLDPELDAVFIATRHHLHAEQALAALKAGKRVWVEKPLCLHLEELSQIQSVYPAPGARRAGHPMLMVGFNRRFAPMAVALRRALQKRREPVEIRIRVNAGRLEVDHWTLDRDLGGGRIVGEACHFIDLARFLAGSELQAASCQRRDTNGQDGGCFELTFRNQAKAVIDYRTDLPSHIPKEVVEVKGKDFTATIHNWTQLRSRGMRGLCRGGFWSRTPRKGHEEAVAAFLKASRAGSEPIPAAEIFEVTEFAIRLQGSACGDTIRKH